MQTFETPVRFNDRQFRAACSGANWSDSRASDRKRYHRASRRHSRKIIDFALLEYDLEIECERAEFQQLYDDYEYYYDRLADEAEARDSYMNDGGYSDDRYDDLDDLDADYGAIGAYDCPNCRFTECGCYLGAAADRLVCLEPGESIARYALRDAIAHDVREESHMTEPMTLGEAMRFQRARDNEN